MNVLNNIFLTVIAIRSLFTSFSQLSNIIEENNFNQRLHLTKFREEGFDNNRQIILQ